MPIGGVAEVGTVTTSYNISGLPGLVDLPTAEVAPDGEFVLSFGSFGPHARGAMTFQATPRITASFRYTKMRDFGGGGAYDYFDRSFDVRFRLLNESKYLPAVSVGLNDFIGTGVYSSEYVVATKSFLDNRLRVTGGLGWGRLGSRDPIGSLSGVRPPWDYGEGGTLSASQWFKGDFAPFGGLSYQVNDKLTFKAEYSSDAYLRESEVGIVELNSPLNFMVDYKWSQTTNLSLFYLYGDMIGGQLTFSFNPKRPASRTGFEAAPLPVKPRAATGWDKEWINDASNKSDLQKILADAFAKDGQRLQGMALTSTDVEIQIQNKKYNSPAQAVGRAARLLTRVMPPSVGVFRITLVDNGVPMSTVVARRSDIEALEHSSANEIFERAQIVEANASNDEMVLTPGEYPKFSWAITPYAELSLFDPDNPIRSEFGIRASAKYEITPGFVLSGAVAQSIWGDVGVGEASPSLLQPVRSHRLIYARDGDPAIEHLTASWYTRLGKNMYGRVTAGYLEPMFGGVSAEVLWKPVDSRLALGAEVNWVKQRDYNQLFGFQDYSVATGHLSAYYDLGSGFGATVHAGRYLVGDWGATFALDRKFDNGWEVGAFATFTDVSAEQFGEGSFDKGIHVTIPLEWALGQPSRGKSVTKIHSLSRDGGARLDVDGRLYDWVSDGHGDALASRWGKFWR
ncbi:YjbH domain-containing protein [Aliiroseovarius sp. KMU-50]|uniref:YjbH domain-containing protein n=1 Tax=Aliiroseovarius salicola TaxID=3009082 RepID=A0ABT4W4D2_9RHOB|nr:YjbH domain-containing protein [Aliiroseovarius sp. KMU-50]MDA5095377.1 YjbH domain-containing protein [Aliiroseovarius sp. KMU-50]